MAKVPKVGETDFTVNWLVEAANRDLAGGIGNMSQRVVSMVHRYRAGFVPDPVRWTSTRTRRQSCCPRGCRTTGPGRQGVGSIRPPRCRVGGDDVVNAANRYVEQAAPW